ncbi:MAG: response regulator [Phototrophicaceae bacterium]|jgi:CheY-like chemotaxis protein
MDETLLYVEDNPTNADLITKQLIRENMIVLVAETGYEGIEMAIHHNPNIILLDFNLPDLSGIEVMERLRKMPSMAQTPVIMLTADSTSNVRQHALDAGCVDFLLKPVGKQDLLKTLRQHLVAYTMT